MNTKIAWLLKMRNVLGLALCATVGAQAQVVVGPVGVVSNSIGGTAANLYDERNVGYLNGVTNFVDYTSGSPSGGAYWISDVFVPTGTMVFDLGATMTINGMALWQGSHFYSQDVQRYSLRVSDDASFATGVTDLGSFFPAIEPVLPSVNMFSDTSGRYVEWTVNSNWGNGFGTHGFEVAFSATVVPEPANFAWLSGLGCGLLALRKWRRGLLPTRAMA